MILAATLLIAGCSKDVTLSEDSGDAIKYDVSFASIGSKSSPAQGTKGQLVNETGSDAAPQDYGITKFVASAYNGETALYSNQEVKYSDSKWSTTETYYWPQNTSLDFYAYANLPASTAYTSVAIAQTGVTLSGYTVPETAADQKDILLGSYHGTGYGKGTAEIRFEHPLTAVRFIYGEIDDNQKIKSISLEGVAASGTATMDAEGAIAWSGVTSFNKTVNQTKESGLDVNATSKLIGEPFIIIPQDLAENNVKVVVSLANGKSFEAGLTTGEWLAGKTNSYTLYYGELTGWTLTVTPWDEGESGDMSLSESIDVAGEVLRSYDNTEGASAYTVTSEYPWKLQYTLDGTTWIDAVAGQTLGESGKEWISFDVVSGEGNGIPATVTATVAAASGSTETIETDHQKALRNASPRGVESNPWDLSMHDIYGNFNASGRTTANCYVVSAPGWYSFPLVYGNAIKDGAVNTDAYAPDAATAGKLYLTPFKKADGAGIESPYIAGATKAWPLWEDVPEYAIINNTEADCKIVGTGADAKVVFHVNQSTLTQGNVVIAVSNGTDILWSWHIWVTDADLTPIAVKNHAGVGINMFPQNLGWVDGSTTKSSTGYPAANMNIRFVQTSGDNGVITKTVRRKEHIIESTATTEGSCPTWQHGRKDPFMRSNGRTNDELTAYSGTPIDKTKSASTGSGCDIAFGIKNPTFFVIQGDGDHHQWYIENNDYDYQYLNLWSALTTKENKEGYQSKPVKTVYDPCPPGFQIPQGDAFSGFITTDDLQCTDASKFNVVGAYSNGWNFKTGNGDKTIVFPAAGARRATAGTLGYAGSAGLYWAAIPLCIVKDANTNVSVGMQFQSGEVSPLANHKRSWGYTVRPVQE